MGIPGLTSLSPALPFDEHSLTPPLSSSSVITVDLPSLLRLDSLPSFPPSLKYAFNLEGVAPLHKLGAQLLRLNAMEEADAVPLFRAMRVLHEITSRLPKGSYVINHCATEAEHGPMTRHVVSGDSDFHILLPPPSTLISPDFKSYRSTLQLPRNLPVWLGCDYHVDPSPCFPLTPPLLSPPCDSPALSSLAAASRALRLARGLLHEEVGRRGLVRKVVGWCERHGGECEWL